MQVESPYWIDKKRTAPGCCGRACFGSCDPALVPEAPVGLIKKDSTRWSSLQRVHVDGDQQGAQESAREKLVANTPTEEEHKMAAAAVESAWRRK